MNLFGKILVYIARSIDKIILSSLVFFLFLVVIFFTVLQFIDLETYKEQALEEIQKKTDLKISYSQATLVLVPHPGVLLEYITITDEGIRVAELNRLRFEIAILPLLEGKLEIRGLSLDSGRIDLYRNKKGEFAAFSGFIQPGDVSDSEDAVEWTPDRILTLLPSNTSLDNIHLFFHDALYKKEYTLYIWKSQLDVLPYARTLHLDFYGKYNDRKIEIYTDVYWNENLFSYETLRFSGTVELDKFNVSIVEDILVMFPKADFRHTTVSGRVKIIKLDDDLSQLQWDNAHIQNFQLPGGRLFGDIHGKTGMSYSNKSSRLGFDGIQVEWKDHIKAKGYGYLTFDDKPVIYFKADADYADIHTIFKVVNLWLDPDLERSPILSGMPDTGYKDKFLLTLDINIRNAYAYERKFENLSTKIFMKRYSIIVNNITAQIYQGLVSAEGEINLKPTIPKINFNVNVQKLQVESILESLSRPRHLTGTLSSNFQLQSEGLIEKDILKSLRLHGSLQLENGELLDYLNILRPIAGIGKIINFTGPPGKSTAFAKIETGFQYKHETVEFKNLIMKGVGLDAYGSGTVSLQGNLDVKLTVALAGVAGKVLKLPILFKGRYGANLPYVDPVWVGSVYAGTVFLAGPVGATVGGIAGSAASDYIDKAIGAVKGFFFKKTEPATTD